MRDRIAKFISGISSPFIMVFVFGLWCVAASVHTMHDFLLFGGLCIFWVSVLPFLYIWLQIKLGNITDIHVAVREQRTLPLLVATLGALFLGISYYFLQAPRTLLALAVSLLISGIIFGLVTVFWKISIHSATFTGSVVMVAFIINIHLLWLLLFLPAIIWARLARKRHHISQAIVASILNAISVAAVLHFLLQ